MYSKSGPRFCFCLGGVVWRGFITMVIVVMWIVWLSGCNMSDTCVFRVLNEEYIHVYSRLAHLQGAHDT